MKIKILSAARQDLLNGYRFYENQAEGIGEYFIDTLFSDIDSLVISAGVHPLYFNKYHRLLSQRFPYAIYYQVKEDTIRVYAVLDSRQNPEKIFKRLNS